MRKFAKCATNGWARSQWPGKQHLQHFKVEEVKDVLVISKYILFTSCERGNCSQLNHRTLHT